MKTKFFNIKKLLPKFLANSNEKFKVLYFFTFFSITYFVSFFCNCFNGFQLIIHIYRFEEQTQQIQMDERM
jgi:hypothetical protein